MLGAGLLSQASSPPPRPTLQPKSSGMHLSPGCPGGERLAPPSALQCPALKYLRPDACQRRRCPLSLTELEGEAGEGPGRQGPRGTFPPSQTGGTAAQRSKYVSTRTSSFTYRPRDQRQRAEGVRTVTATRTLHQARDLPKAKPCRTALVAAREA